MNEYRRVNSQSQFTLLDTVVVFGVGGGVEIEDVVGEVMLTLNGRVTRPQWVFSPV